MGRLTPKVTIELDRPRTLSLTLNALIAYEEKTGANLFAALQESNTQMVAMREMLWAALLGDDPSLTLEDVGDMIHPGNISEVTEALNHIIDSSMPENQGGGDADPFPGTESGQPEDTTSD